MASGKPIVATNVGGIPYIVRNGKNGIIVKQGDHEALAEAIKKLLRSTELQKQMGENGLQLSKKYGWDNIVSQIEQLYQKVLSNY